jgi:hypothetical protein
MMMRKIASLFGCLTATLALSLAQTLVIDYSNETEGNDTITLANNLGVVGVDSTNTRRMKVVRGLINPDGDNDYFRVELAQNGTYSFRVDCTLDSVLTLYNASGTLVAENDDDEIGNNNRGNRDTSFTNADSGITISLNAGVYFVRVRSITPAGTLARFRYTLRVFDGSTARDFDPYEVSGTNETFGTATNVGNLADDFTLIPNGFLRYRQTDLDYYRIEIGAGNLTVRTIGATDTIVTIYDSAFNPLAENDDDSHDPFNPYTSRVTLGNLPAGIYYIRVEGIRLSRGTRGRLVRCADYRLRARAPLHIGAYQLRPRRPEPRALRYEDLSGGHTEPAVCTHFPHECFGQLHYLHLDYERHGRYCRARTDQPHAHPSRRLAQQRCVGAGVRPYQRRPQR